MAHAIVEQMEPSTEQRRAIDWRGGDLLVTAGAGSGKTRTLVARYLALLAEGLPLRSLVAITFTRKAAREMRNRIRLQVQRYLASEAQDQPSPPAPLPQVWERGAEDCGAAGPLLLDHTALARQYWLEIYAALDAARIGTIHALCSEFLRAHPAEAQVDPRFEVLDEAQTSLLRQRAVDTGLAWAANAPEVAVLYDLLDEGPLRAAAEAMLDRRLDMGPALQSGASPWPDWQKVLTKPLANFVDNAEVCAAFAELLALRGSNIMAHAEAVGDELVPILQDLCRAWSLLGAARTEEDWEAASRWLTTLDGLLKQKGKKGNWAPADPKETIRSLRGLYDALPPWLRKGDLVLDHLLAEAMPALSRLYTSLVDAYKRLRDERNALDFDDLEERALALLQEHPEVLARWREDIQAILVDEFQDTNRRQLKLVELLNGERGRATFVGDDKQSIYRFRGAEVILFRDLKRRCASQDGTDSSQMAALNLQVSYRAHGELLAGLNELLRPALGEHAADDLRDDGHGPLQGWAPPYIELHLTIGTRGQDQALERAACALASRLAELVAGGRLMREGPVVRPLGYGDMAILCRASRSFAAYEDALDDAGIPFTTVAGRGFYQRPEIRDLLNALRALSEPHDDLALAGFLRSPSISVSDPTLYTLCRLRKAANCDLWHMLQGAPLGAARIDDGQREHVRRAVDLVNVLHQRVGRTPVADLIKTFVDETNYRAALRQAGQGRAVRNVDKLLADAHASGIVSVGEFLEYISLLRDTGAREGEARATNEGAVQIMTVHAAKGLEFPIVALGDASADKGSLNRALVDPEMGLLLPLRLKDETPADERFGINLGSRWPAGYLRAKEQEQAKEREESGRVLYVAATRAREMLLVSGCVKLGKDKRPSGLGEWLGWLGEPLALCEREIAYNEAGQRAIRLALQAGKAPVACTIYEPQCPWERGNLTPGNTTASFTSDAPLLDPVGAAKVVLPSLQAESESPVRSELGQRVWQVMPAGHRIYAPAWVVGQLVHEALSMWRFPDAGYGTWAEARARTLGLLDPRMLRDAAARSATLLNRFRSHDLYTQMSCATERRSELPYTLRDANGQTDNGVIDALYRLDGQWTIIEFKTDHVRDVADTQCVLDKGYLTQAKRYVKAVQDLLGQRPRHIFCWLDYANKVVCESLLE